MAKGDQRLINTWIQNTFSMMKPWVIKYAYLRNQTKKNRIHVFLNNGNT